MKQREKVNSGFSLIELIIALAVMAFLMLAVSSFMGSGIMQSKKAKVDVRMQTQAQETYSLITDTIMQANDIVIVGYTQTAGGTDINFEALDAASDDGPEVTGTFEKKYFVCSEEAKDILINAAKKDIREAKYGIPDSESISDSQVVLFSKVKSDEKIYVERIAVDSSVPININQTNETNTSGTSFSMTNDITKESRTVTCTEVTESDGTTKKVYSEYDTLASVFYFVGENLYYGRRYGYMTKQNDIMDTTDDTSLKNHLYNKYFSYVNASGGTQISGCVATVNAADNSVGIDLYYNQSSMTYTTLGQINLRNSHVLQPKK